MLKHVKTRGCLSEPHPIHQTLMGHLDPSLDKASVAGKGGGQLRRHQRFR